MTEEQILQGMVDECDALIEEYRRLENKDIPRTVDDALDSGWELSIDIAGLTGSLGYSDDARKADKKRLVRMSDAIRAGRNYEYELVQNLVTDPGMIVLNTLASGVDAAISFAKIMRAIPWGKTTLETWKWIVRTFVTQYFKVMLGASGILGIVAVVKEARSWHNSQLQVLDRKALPQRREKRYRKRRPSRQ